MEWFETEDRAAFFDTASRYASWLKENVAERREDGASPEELFDLEMVEHAAGAGLLHAPLSEERGGVGLDMTARAAILERVAAGRAGASVVLAAHWAALDAAGENADAEGAKLLGLAIPAPVVDLDRPLTPMLSESGGGLSLTGDYICIIHPSVTERVAAPAVAGSGEPVLLSLGGPSLSKHCSRLYAGSGLGEAAGARLALDDIEVMPEDVAARGARAEAAISAARRGLYIGLGAAMIGNARASADYAYDYAHERVQTGRPIVMHMEVRRILENMRAVIEAARAMVLAAAALGGGDEALDRARRAFTFAGTACEAACLDAVQVLGGYGYMEDYGLERRLRDVKSIQCLVGSHSLEWTGQGW